MSSRGSPNKDGKRVTLMWASEKKDYLYGACMFSFYMSASNHFERVDHSDLIHDSMRVMLIVIASLRVTVYLDCYCMTVTITLTPS